MSRAVGNEAEERASCFLQTQGYTIVCRNFYSKFGEIDIVALKNNILHFCEVKYSKNADPLFRITPSKMQKIIKTIGYYCLKNPTSYDYQIDALLVSDETIELIENMSY